MAKQKPSPVIQKSVLLAHRKRLADGYVELFDHSHKKFMDSKNGGRSGAIAALEYAIFSISKLEHKKQINVTPLIVLLNALRALDIGITLPILRKSKKDPKTNQRGIGSHTDRLRMNVKAFSVYAADTLKTLGVTPQKAADERIGKALSKIKFPAKSQSQGITGRTIAGWRQEIAEDKSTYLASKFEEFKSLLMAEHFTSAASFEADFSKQMQMRLIELRLTNEAD